MILRASVMVGTICNDPNVCNPPISSVARRRRNAALAETVADMAGAEVVGRINVVEVLSYRRQPPPN